MLGRYGDAGVVGVRGHWWGFSVGQGGQHRTASPASLLVPKTHSFVGLFAPETQHCDVDVQRHQIIEHFYVKIKTV